MAYLIRRTSFRSRCLAVRRVVALALCAARSQFQEPWSRVLLGAATSLQPRFKDEVGHIVLLRNSMCRECLPCSFQNSGSPVLTRFSKGPVRSARTPSRVPTLVPMDADILLASADDNPSLPTPAERRACASWSIARIFLIGEPRASAAPGSSRTCSLHAVRCQSSDTLRGVNWCPQRARGSWFSVRGSR